LQGEELKDERCGDKRNVSGEVDGAGVSNVSSALEQVRQDPTSIVHSIRP